jgi:hypothetical protein
VSGGPATRLQTNAPGQKIQLVVHDHELLGTDSLFPDEPLDGASRFVHVRRRDGEHHRPALELGLVDTHLSARAPELGIHLGRQALDELGPDVVSRPLVGRAGIPQADDDVGRA